MLHDAKERIIRAAELLCQEDGPEKLTLDQVAQRAKVGKGTIYRHFENKDDVLFNVIKSSMNTVYQETSEKIDLSEGDYLAKLELVVISLDEYFRDHSTVISMAFYLAKTPPPLHQGEYEGPLQILTTVLNRLIAPLISEGMSKGDLRTDLPPPVLGMFFHSLIQMYSRIRSHPLGRNLESSTLMDLFLSGACRKD